MPVGTTLKGWGRALLLRVARVLGGGGIAVGLLFLGAANIFVDSVFYLMSLFYDAVTYGLALVLVYLLYRLMASGQEAKDAQIAGLRETNTNVLARVAALERELREARGEPEPAPGSFLSRFR
jgi:threonine/homoserine/homoserine lactone efflux protein